tara:strand:- start:367 stop:477 length:111 start_codon:yes stop_codon:yes gene_type:complete
VKYIGIKTIKSGRNKKGGENSPPLKYNVILDFISLK